MNRCGFGNAVLTYEYLCCQKSDKWIYSSGGAPKSKCNQRCPGWTIVGAVILHLGLYCAPCIFWTILFISIEFFIYLYGDLSYIRHKGIMLSAGMNVYAAGPAWCNAMTKPEFMGYTILVQKLSYIARACIYSTYGHRCSCCCVIMRKKNYDFIIFAVWISSIHFFCSHQTW